MKSFVLRVEGVNFGNCLYDTNDLSTIRGASLLLDSVSQPIAEALSTNVGRPITAEWAGGSKAVFRFEATSDQCAAAEQAARELLCQAPWRHLTWVLDLAEGEGADLKAEARNHTRQFRQWTVDDCRLPDAWRQDALDGARPALLGGEDPIKGPLSPATQDRRKHGRQNRSLFFKSRAGDILPQDTRFCDDFEDIVAKPPKGLSLSAEGKIAVLHFDGDGFGDAARNLNQPSRFAAELNGLMKGLLRVLVETALTLELEEGGQPEAPILRLETLVWGGDDITLVVPAWRAMKTAQILFETVKDWHIGGCRLGFTGAAIIAHHKAPIRRLVALAQEAVNAAKDDGARGTFSIDIFESATPAEDGLAAHRSRAFPGLTAGQLAIVGSKMADLAATLHRYTDPNSGLLSRARLHTLMHRQHPEADLNAELLRDSVRVQGLDHDLQALPEVHLPLHKDTDLATKLELVLAYWDYAPWRKP